jgi:hypothetical protein
MSTSSRVSHHVTNAAIAHIATRHCLQCLLPCLVPFTPQLQQAERGVVQPHTFTLRGVAGKQVLSQHSMPCQRFGFCSLLGSPVILLAFSHLLALG